MNKVLGAVPVPAGCRLGVHDDRLHVRRGVDQLVQEAKSHGPSAHYQVIREKIIDLLLCLVVLDDPSVF